MARPRSVSAAPGPTNIIACPPCQNIAAPGSNAPCSAANLQGYNTAQTAAGAAACNLGVGGGVAPIAGSIPNGANLYTGVNASGLQ